MDQPVHQRAGCRARGAVLSATPGRPSALVSGGSSGIGLAVASRLAHEGYDLTIVGRDAMRLEDARAALAVAGGAIQTVAVDLSEDGSARRVVAAHGECFSGLDVVVANGGWSRAAAVADTDAATLRALLAVHLESAFALAGAALPWLRRPLGGRPAWFLVTSSLAAEWPVPGFAAYSAAKSALVSLARSINAEEGGNGVRACALCPAFVDTPLTVSIRSAVPQSEMLRPDDVAAAVGFLLSLSPSALVSKLVIERRDAPPLTP